MDERHLAMEAIRRKLIGKRLTYKEIYSIMDQISQNKLGDVLTTYFAASGFSKGFTDSELYYLTRAMVETGERLHFKGIVADKHSIGGMPGTRTTLIVVPIIAAAGFKIPKSSSRAITTPSGTADDMEILAPVMLSKDKIYSVIEKTNGCIVGGGSFNIAPADDVIIKVEEVLLFESYDKILISVMAKKIAFGSNHVVIDIPWGEQSKISKVSDAQVLKRKFESLAERFGIKIEVLIHKTEEPAGRGIGPVLAPAVTSDDLKPGKYTHKIKAKKNGALKSFDVKNLTAVARILGSPKMKKSGIYLNKKIGEKYVAGEEVITLYCEKLYNLEEAKETLIHLPLFQ